MKKFALVLTLALVLGAGLIVGTAQTASAHSAVSTQSAVANKAQNSCWGWQYWVYSYAYNHPKSLTFAGHCNVQFLNSQSFQYVYSYLFNLITRIGVPGWLADWSLKMIYGQWGQMARADRGCGVYIWQDSGSWSTWSAC